MDEISNELLVYEVGYHILPTIEESEVGAETEKIRSAIGENQGIIVSEEAPKIMTLSYEISKNINSKKQKFNRAYFGWIKFEIEPGRVSAVKNKLENLQSILRFLIIKTVREDTIHAYKMPLLKREGSKEGRREETDKREEASEEEIDKSIDELLVDEKSEN